MRGLYRVLGDPSLVADTVTALPWRTVILDVEPLIAPWGTDQRYLDAGIAMLLDGLAAGHGEARHIVFSTNSARRPSVLPSVEGLHVAYVSHAGKPLRIAQYRGLPRPGAVIGDQMCTDGVLAWRLGFVFVDVAQEGVGVPAGPRLLHDLGRPLRRLLFRPS